MRLLLVFASTCCSSATPLRLTSRPHVSTCSSALDDHLRDALSTQRLAALERLALETGKCVEHGREQQNYSSGDQTGDPRGNASPLYCAHDGVEAGAQEIGLEFADESIELGRRRTDSEEQRNLEEQDHGRVYSVRTLEAVCDKVLLYLQAYDTKRNDPIGVEQVRYSERKA
jgi:hypothetical protein